MRKSNSTGIRQHGERPGISHSYQPREKLARYLLTTPLTTFAKEKHGMMEFLAAIENSGFSTFIRENPSVLVYATILASHTFGMAFLVGTNAAIDLRILGIAPSLPLGPMEKFFPVMALGFWVNALSGLVLTSLTPTKFFTTPVFYIKLLAIALAIVNLRLLRTRVFGNPANLGTSPVPMEGKILAGTSLAFWGVAVLSGRVVSYDAWVQRQASVAVLIAAGVMLLAGSFAPRLRGSLLKGKLRHATLP